MKLSPTNKIRLVALIVCVFLLIVTLLTDRCDKPNKAQQSTVTHIYFTLVDRGTIRESNTLLEIVDMDKDGAVTLGDALAYAHRALDKSTNYAVEDGNIQRAWGVSDGYYRLFINEQPAGELTAPVSELDRIALLIENGENADAESRLDFDPVVTLSQPEEGRTLTLYRVSAGERTPLTGAVVLVDGEDTGLRTGGDGSVTLRFPYAASYVITAESESGDEPGALCAFLVERGE